MGEAKRKSERKEAFLRLHPHCCFCGGATLATTVDHVPSVQMFSLRRRPKGLEVPACDTCNQATKQHEQVAAMFGRVYISGGPSRDETHELGRIIEAVHNNIPGLLEEMNASPHQLESFAQAGVNLPGIGGVINASGPLVNRSMQVFGAKIGYALFYSTVHRIIPPAGGVAVRWYSNYDKMTGRIPSDLLQILGPPNTLRQGKWDASDQFNYLFAMTNGAEMAVYFSTFRQSFAVVSLVSDDVTRFEDVTDNNIYRPGQL